MKLVLTSGKLQTQYKVIVLFCCTALISLIAMYYILLYRYIGSLGLSAFGLKMLEKSCFFFFSIQIILGTASIGIARNTSLKIILLPILVILQYFHRILIFENIELYLISSIAVSFFLGISCPLKSFVVISFSMMLAFVFMSPIPNSYFSYLSADMTDNILVLIVSMIVYLSIIFSRAEIERSLILKNGFKRELETNQQLIEFNVQLQNFVKEREVDAAQEERKRITREMHDANGYHFTNIMALMNAGISSGNKDWSIIENIFQLASTEAHKGLLDSRRILHQLRDSFFHTATRDFIGEIYYVVSIFRKCTGVDVDINYGNLAPFYNPSLMTAISRIVQEGLVNAVKHGKATYIEISFWQENNMLTFFIEDNGIGSDQITKGIGFKGMEERIRPFGGNLEYNSYSGVGFKLTVSVFLPDKEACFD